MYITFDDADSGKLPSHQIQVDLQRSYSRYTSKKPARWPNKS